MHDEMFVTKIDQCARCHGDHGWLQFWSLTHPIVDGDGTTWTMFALCPTNGEPILLRQSAVVVDTAVLDTPPTVNVAIVYGDPGELKPRC